MTNTKFRKRALLSSVAMLLVALIALGSATFAWFVNNPNVQATGIVMKTTAAEGLVARTDSDNTWDHNVDLNKGQATFDLTPASMTEAGAFCTGGAALDTGYELGSSATTTVNAAGWTAPTGEGAANALGTYTAPTYAYKENIYFKLSGSNTTATDKHVFLTGVTIANSTATGDNNLLSALRVAIFNGSTCLGIYATDTTGEHGYVAAGATSATTPTAFTKLAAANTVNGTTGKVDTGLTGFSGAATLTKAVTVYVYLDGQDGATYTNHIGSADISKIADGITLDFVLDTAA